MEERRGAKKYRVSIDLVKRYETYVYANNSEEAVKAGRAALEDGEGDLIDDVYKEDSIKVEEMRKYKATQTVTYTYEHYMDAADNDEAALYAKRQFEEVRGIPSKASSVTAGPIKLEWL